jgi:hypothetical protein
MDERRYRQSGYKDTGRPREAPRRPPDPPNPSALLKTRSLSRCAACGTTLPITAGSLAECPNCRAALQTCRQCAHFDPGHRFECTEAVSERIADKQQRNDCGLFTLRVTLERETTSGATRPDDVRRGFNNLFKR